MILLLAAAVWLIALMVTAADIIPRQPRAGGRPPSHGHERFFDVLAIGGLGAATGLFFWRLLAGQVWMPAGGGDLAQFLYPTLRFAAEWWRQGIIPLWNPYLFAGAPYVGDPQSGIFYPLYLLAFLVSSPLTFRDLELLSVLHFFIAGAGMYAFLRWGEWGVGTRDWGLGIGDLRLPIADLGSSAASRAITHGGQNSKSAIENRESEIPIPQSQISNPQLHPLAALAGAIAFEFSDLFITHFGNLNLIAVAAWTPLVLLFYRRAVADRRPGFAAIAGVLLAIAYHAGHPQAFLFVVMLLVLWAAFETAVTLQSPISNPDRATTRGATTRGATTRGATTRGATTRGATTRVRPYTPISNLQSLISGLRSPSHPLVFLVLTGLVAFGLAAPALLPGLEMTQQTLRVDFAYEQAAEFSLPPAELIGLVVPGFFGRGPENAWAPWPRVEVGYLGVLPLLLALLAVLLRRDAPARFLGLLALLGLALALGGYAVLHGWLYQFAPGFGQLRAPARFIFLFDFAAAALAGLGLHTLLRALPSASEITFKRIVRTAPWAFLLIALAAGSTVYAILVLGQGQDPVLFRRIANAANALAFFILLLGLSVALVVARGTRFFRRRVWAVLALALIFFDLFSLGAYVDTSPDDPTRVYEHPDAVAFFKSDAELHRIDPRETGVDRTWPADSSILYGLFDVNGDNPLVLADFDRYWQALGSRSSRLYDLLNAKYLIGRKNVPLDRAKFQLAFDGDPAFDVYENTRALPRAFMVFDAQSAPNHAAALEAIHAPDFDPARTVVLEGGSGVTSTQIAAGAGASVKITGYGPNEIVLETSATAPAVLVLSEVYYPGWRAYLAAGPFGARGGEKEVEVLRANFLFRAVELPAGKHQVRLLYDPASFKLGLGLFVLTVVGLLAWGVASRRYAFVADGKGEP